MAHGLVARTVSGVKWSSLATATNVLFQLGFVAVMARLLEPRDFGLMAMAHVAMRFAGYFAQLGVGPALIQRRNLEPDDVRVAFTISVLVGLAFLGLGVFLAPIVGALFRSESLVDIVRVLAASFLLVSVSNVAVFLLRRELRFRALAAVEIASYVIGYGATGMAFALSGAGVWSLVAAVLGQNLCTLVLSYFAAQHPVRPLWDVGRARRFVAFGARYSVNGFLEFVQANLDTFVIGRVLGAGALGIYNRAYMLTNLPVQLAVTSATKVLYPALSERQDDRRKVGELYLALLFVTVGIVGGIAAGIVPAAEALVLTLLGEKWADAIEVVQVVALAVPFVFASHLSGIVFDSLGLLSVKLKLQTLTIVLFAVLLALAYSAGLVAIGVALVLTEATKLCAYVLLTRRALGLTLPHVAYAIGAGCVVCAGVALPSVLLGTLLTGTGMAPWVRLALAIAVGIGALAVTLTFMWRKIARTSMFGAVGSRLPLLGRLVPRQAQ